PLRGVPIDGQRVVTSDHAIALPKVPGKLLVIGAGVIGLELGSVWRRLGAQVTVVEFLDRILPGMDGDVSKQMQRILTKQGMAFKLATKVMAAKPGKAGVELTLQPAAGGAAETISVDVVLVAVGRKPYTDALGLAEAGVALDDKGRVKTDAHFQTNVPGIYAIGDVIAGPMLAHKASEEGVACVERMVTGAGHLNYDAIPNIVYTHPEIASVGKTEEELKAAGTPYRKGSFPFLANGRAKALGTTDGFVKFLAHPETDRILGVHILGPRAGDLIAEVAVAIEFGASSEDLARCVHAHPTLAESVKEAALAVDKRQIHL
ncbi:MAG: dihydrolipoyl dehydrogenase, partial [Planctomycetota bacterium]|nr:dihydrolipoyl dehydrogenase [Planctomycetota bacterium]